MLNLIGCKLKKKWQYWVCDSDHKAVGKGYSFSIHVSYPFREAKVCLVHGNEINKDEIEWVGGIKQTKE